VPKPLPEHPLAHTQTPSSADILPYAATEATLPNGLRVIIVPTGFPNLVSLQIPVQTGSRNEVEPGKSGFAHFFEHMMFRGTERFSSEAYQDVMTRTGARQNAYTTDDYTNYHITFAAEDLETILELEADRFMNLKYSEDDFKTESRAILGEYNKSASDPLTKLFEVQRDNAYAVHTYKHTTMGFLRDIEDMPNQFAYSRTFFERWYRPEYTTIIIAGDVEPSATLALVERHWGSWQSGRALDIHIPQEPEPRAPVVAHVDWSSPTLPWVTVAFHGPAFSAVSAEYAALDTLLDLSFGETSDIYRQLVEVEQKVDQFFPYLSPSQDPSLATVFARLKDPADAPYVRDAILRTVTFVRETPVDSRRLAEAKSNARYSFARTLDNSESVASTLARFVRFERAYDTLNALFRQYESLTPAALHEAARRYLTDQRMVITTLSQQPLPPAVGQVPSLHSFSANSAAAIPAERVLVQKTPSPLLRFKLLFEAGSAHDPEGKPGLATLTASVIAEGGSQHLRIDEITRALFPMAGSFGVQVDREMTTFTGVIHRDNLTPLLDIVLPQLLEPGFREDDFARLKEQQRNALVQDLRSNNDEELGKERLQANVFADTPYGHTALGALSGIDTISLDDVRTFAAGAYTQSRLTLGIAGDISDEQVDHLRARLGALPAGIPVPRITVEGRVPRGLEVEILKKDTRSVAVSLGHPLRVTRADPDFAALWLARAWLGEHRASHGRLFQRIREARGMNYGNYAYIEAFPRGMYQFFPDPNRARTAQLFEIWLRPLVPDQAVFGLKVALFELERLISDGISDEDFEATRTYLSKNVFVMLKTQDQQLGYALDSRWYGMDDFAHTMRERLATLTVEEVNRAVRQHLSGGNLSVVMVAADAEALRDALLSSEDASITYDAPKPKELLDEDARIAARPLPLKPESIRIRPVEEVFA
jgi:zinc protease